MQDFKVGTYGTVIHEMDEASLGLAGEPVVIQGP